MSASIIASIEANEIVKGDIVIYKNEYNGHFKGCQYKVVGIGAHNTVTVKPVIKEYKEVSELVDRVLLQKI